MTLKFAEGLCIQLSNFKNLPIPICEILGFPINEKKSNDDLDILDLLTQNFGTSSLASSSHNISENHSTPNRSTLSKSTNAINKSSSSKKSDETMDILDLSK